MKSSVLALILLLSSCGPKLTYPKGSVIARLPIPAKGANVFKIQSPDQKQTVIVVAPDGYVIERGKSLLVPPDGLPVPPGERWGFAGDLARRQYHAIKMSADFK
jgi:hypothetical protein